MKNLLDQNITKIELMSTTSFQNLASKTGISENEIEGFASELKNNGEMSHINLVNMIWEHLEMFDI